MGLIYSKETKARKQHTCDYCGFKIKIGETYQRSFNSDGGDVWTWKNHKDCEQLCRDMGMFKEVPEGVDYDCFWQYVFDYFKDNSGMDIDETPNQEILEWVKSKVTNPQHNQRKQLTTA
tara:strand:- start:1978 stop:2334 length:357 start_codon:yes stop_codon:yes gene_type:complete